MTFVISEQRMAFSVNGAGAVGCPYGKTVKLYAYHHTQYLITGELKI